jgi:hypothetical protein
MSNQIDPQNYEAPLIYQIRIKGHLPPQWTEWFDNATITWEADGSTLLTCTIIDQAALHGLLKKVRDLGLPLLSVNRMDTDQGDSPDT